MQAYRAAKRKNCDDAPNAPKHATRLASGIQTVNPVSVPTNVSNSDFKFQITHDASR